MNFNRKRHKVFTMYTALRMLYFLCVLCSFRVSLYAQDAKPVVQKLEIKQLTHISDSLHKYWKTLYAKELKAKTPNAYQPERIAAIRTYLLLFDYVQRRCEVASFDKTDIVRIFGKPGSTIYENNNGDFQLYYDKMIKPYVRIVNLRYRFYFKKNELVKVVREML